ncbi:MAG TPA: hypothetical protein VIG44_11170 [Thermomicrobiales bacterium]
MVAQWGAFAHRPETRQFLGLHTQDASVDRAEGIGEDEGRRTDRHEPLGECERRIEDVVQRERFRKLPIHLAEEPEVLVRALQLPVQRLLGAQRVCDARLVSPLLLVGPGEADPHGDAADEIPRQVEGELRRDVMPLDDPADNLPQREHEGNRAR